VEPRFTFITLGVDDLESSLKFYRDGLGLATKGIVGREFEHGAVVFFDFEGGMKLALYSRDNLAHDAQTARTSPSPTEFSIGHLVSSRDQVDAIMEQAKRAGAKIVKPPQDAFWGGYHGYFQDPDGHLWEIAWNPKEPVPAS
jgi:catechol 2,3-dioxygenase-like lactoylglutathione lyase family enzyme